jgi:hypothetical protein
MSRRALFKDIAFGTILPVGVAAFTATQTPVSNAGGVAGGVVDLGAGQYDGSLVADVSAISAAGADQSYDLIIQGSSVANFASNIQELCRYRLGNTALRNGAITSLVGRYEIPFNNQEADVEYRFLRVVLVIAGTTPSIQFAGLWVANRAPIS